MNTQYTDEISSNVPIPRAEQEEQVPRATRKLIDIHIYDLPEEETHSVEGTGYTVEAGQSKPDGQHDQQHKEHLHPQQSRKGSPWFLVLLAVLVLVLIAGSLAYVPFFQTATITIVPVSHHLSTTSSMTIVTGQANAAQNQIQGRSLPQMTMSL